MHDHDTHTIPPVCPNIGCEANAVDFIKHCPDNKYCRWWHCPNSRCKAVIDPVLKSFFAQDINGKGMTSGKFM